MAAHPLARPHLVLLVAAGGVVGVTLRWLVLGQLGEIEAILLANGLGCLLLGFLVYEADAVAALDPSSRLFLTTGVCSSLTTYSTFAMQTVLAPDPVTLIVVVAGNYGLGITAVLLGRWGALAVGGRL